MIRRVKKLGLVFLVPAVLAIGLGASTFAAPGEKVNLCHSAGGTKFVEISVSVNALPAHMAHGDLMADEYGDCP